MDHICPFCNLSFPSKRSLANHIRAKHTPNRKKSNFLLFCSCVICKKQITVQSISQHIEKHEKDSNIKGYCLQCNEPLYKKENKFCSSSCSAKYNNKTRVVSDKQKLKTSITLKNKKPEKYKLQFTKISTCNICGKYHSKNGKTCSKECHNKLISLKMKEKINNGYNPQKHRGRHKKSFLETSFENWLDSNFPNIIYEQEKPFNFKEYKVTYFGDFYFPQINLLIELDGTQHNNTKEYDSERDKRISEKYGTKVFRISHSEYINKIKINDVIFLLEGGG